MNLAVLGCGLIGGSAALAWRRAFPDAEVTSYDPDRTALERAFIDGALTRVAATPSDAVAGAGVVLIAAPVSAIGGIAAEVAPALANGAILTDAGSVKAPVIASVRERTSGVRFVGGHPMAGTEQQGFGGARGDLFAGAWWFLTPDDQESVSAAAELAPALRALGAKVVELEPATHDRIVAAVSHLPMLIAAGLVHLAGAPIDDADPRLYAGPGFRDMTRIADSNPQLWVEICLENRLAVMEALSAVSIEATRIERSLYEGDRSGLLSFLEGARESRRRLPDKADRTQLEVVVVDVPDQPGALARVASLLGDAGVNIEDIRVAHSPSGDHGWLYVTVVGARVGTAIDALTTEGFIAESLSR